MTRPDDVLVSPLRRGSRDYPWPGEVIGGCIALRGGRIVAAAAHLPLILLQVMKIPGTNALMRRWSPIGTLAYGERIAALGIQLDQVRGATVQVDWAEEPRDARLLSEGWFLAKIAINNRTVRVDRRCARALVQLWRGAE
ncbi:MAG: hypothetical protein HGA44_19870 [Cellulomonadaceae bacterium]|nr:hypothetical protein [Cellulomonadaceae bacterium]